MYKIFFKNFIDKVLSFLVIIVTFPIFAVFTILLLLVNKGKPFFIQYRPGKNEKIFPIIKFKTMKDTKDINGKLLPDKERLTSIGRFMRKFSIDEIPQLFNVLKGNMSIVGPRPLLKEYLPYYNQYEKQRFMVKPGITGLSQVSGRNELLWTKRMELDVFYAKNVTFLLDIKILLKTAIKVLMREGVSVDVSKHNRAPLHIRRNPKYAGMYDDNGIPINK